MYQSPSETSDGYDSFITSLEKIVVDIPSTNPHFVLTVSDFYAESSNWSFNVLILSDFNAKSSDWSFNATTTADDAQLDYFTPLYGMKQVTTEPTHILKCPASCIDLIS